MAFNAQSYAAQRPDLVNNWNNIVAYRANPNDPRWANDPNIASLAATYPSLDAYLQADWQGSGGDAGASTQSQGNGGNLAAARAEYQATNGSLPNYSDDAFAQWWAQNAATTDLESNPQDFALLTALADSGNQSAAQALGAAGYESGALTDSMPVEQGLFQQIFPSLLGDIQGDAGRRALVNTLTGQATEDYNLARNALSPEENARRLAEEYAMTDQTSGALSQSAATASAEQLAALQQSIEAMKGNLTGDLAAKAQALQDQIASFTANLGTFDATQKAALAEQIAAQQADLEKSIAAQQQNLSTELNSLRSGVDTRTQARQSALTQELASLRDVNTAEATARKAALQQEIASLRTASTEENQARVAALQKEIDGLTAAQAPMTQARLDSANALTTAVNLGLESTNDRLTAERARQGYLGSSSFSDANLARAAIGARQQGAQAMGSAREANAADVRAIQGRAATEGRSLADILAGRNFDISGREATEGRGIEDMLAANQRDVGIQGATGNRGIADEAANSIFDITSRGATGARSLADILAEGTRTIGDTGAAGTAAIKATTGQNLMNIGNAGATQKYQDSVMGSDRLRALLDDLAKGQGSIAGTLAQQQQQARDAGTTARQGYFDNAYTRGQGGVLSRANLGANLANTLTGLEGYGSAGTNRALGTLNWWNTNTGTAPTPGYTPATVDTTGSDIAGLGAGLLGAGLSYGNASGWGQKPKTTTAASSQGVYRDSPYW